jgi:hypothetical protein
VGWIPRRRPPTAYRVICECHAGAIDPGPGDGGAESHSNLSHDPHQRPEIAWNESESEGRVADELSDAGFIVEPWRDSHVGS